MTPQRNTYASVPTRTRFAVAFVALVALGALAVAPAVAHAHAGRAPEPHDLWSAWSTEPLVLLTLALGAGAYVLGVRALWGRAGRGRGVARWRVACFAAGLLAVAIALVSPLDAVSGALFSAHMGQHLLLTMIAPPLLVLGDGGLAMLWALPLRARRAVARTWRRAHGLRAAWTSLSHPATAWVLHAVALWTWHVPRLYDLAVRSEVAHALEHTSFLLTALLFWWGLLDHRARRRIGVGPAVLSLFLAAVHGAVFGAAIALASRPWYGAHVRTTAAWGLTPLEDQQVAGLLMWVPAGIVYLLALAPHIVGALAERGVRAPATAVALASPGARG